jgi:glyoxylase-like metal-dependent hydrolase (beta-lactamase superfamily II)
MEIFPNVYQIHSLVGDRNLFQYLFVGDNVFLLDTGMASTPKEVILPFLRKIGIAPSRLSMAINTHADADHHGGNATLKQSVSEVLLACGDLDREIIENPDRLFAVRYNQWIQEHGVGISANPEVEVWVRGMVGAAHRIDVTLRGGENLAIDEKRSLRVLHVPGHSDGHIALYYPPSRAMFVGDAVHGSYCPAANGAPAVPPAYYCVLAYLSALQLVETFEVEWIYSGHWPAYTGSQVMEFLEESRRFVQITTERVLRALDRHPEGITLRTCIEECGPTLGKWPANSSWLLMYPIYGHLTQLEQQGVVKRVHVNNLTRWRLS